MNQVQNLSLSLNKKSDKEWILKGFLQLMGASFLAVALLVGLGKISGNYTLFKLIPLNFTVQRGWIFFFTSILFGIVAHFSCNYLHKDQGFGKFFLNYIIFGLGLFSFIFGNDIFVMFAGWEFIGVSSVFLIGFYSFRTSPVLNSLYVVSFYKFADILLITSLLLLQHTDILTAHQVYIPILYMGIITAGLIKSGSFPFTSWVPKAMEGPTTTSAIYYGALSVNTGILLITFYIDEILKIPVAKNFLLGAGILTVLYSSFQSRVQNNAKSLLAYSSSIQLGFVLVELSLGFKTFALIHLFTNSFYKVYQFIKSPSLLYSFHEMVGENRSPFKVNGVHFQKILPKKIRQFLYFQNLHHFHLNSFYEWLGEISHYISHFAERLFYPIINKGTKISLWSLMWVVYYLVLTYFINNEAIKVHAEYFDIIPFFIMLVSFSMIHQKNPSSFIALTMIYKILESFIVHGVHTHEPFKIVGGGILTLFILTTLVHAKRRRIPGLNNKPLSLMLIFLMLYFTNFPFLLQSLVNEHIIDAFLAQNMFHDLAFYCLGNTLFNIGIYQFIFNQVYLKDELEGVNV